MSRLPRTVIYHPKAELLRDLLRKVVPELDPEVVTAADDFSKVLPDAEILVCTELSAHEAASARNLRWIQVTSAGIERVLPAREQLSHVLVTNARGIHSELMSDHVLAAMVMLQWDFPRILHDQRERRWRREPKAALAGKTLGIVGAGAIGAEIGRRASHFGMRVLGIRRSGEPLPGFEAVFQPDRLLDVLAQSDFVCVTVPATDATRRLIGPVQFRAMKAGAFFINIARGSVVDEAELIGALRNGSLAGAALDVFETEPPADDNPLWDMPNVIVTPHISGMLDTNEERLVSIFAENLGRYRSGAPLRNMVDLARGY
jgi:phosphoglycerate dehydrogenase-like enzyme